MAALNGKASIWSNVFDNGKATDEADFIRVFMIV